VAVWLVCVHIYIEPTDVSLQLPKAALPCRLPCRSVHPSRLLSAPATCATCCLRSCIHQDQGRTAMMRPSPPGGAFAAAMPTASFGCQVQSSPVQSSSHPVIQSSSHIQSTHVKMLHHHHPAPLCSTLSAHAAHDSALREQIRRRVDALVDARTGPGTSQLQELHSCSSITQLQLRLRRSQL